MAVCAVATCKSYNRNTKGKNIIFHTFPLDDNKQKIWIEKCKRKDTVNPRTARICSQHFSSENYIRDLKSELLGLPPKRRLKPDAVPTLNLPSVDNNEIKSSKLSVDSCTSFSPTVNRSTMVRKILRKTRCLICDVAAKPLFHFPTNIKRMKMWLQRLGLEELMEQHKPAYIQKNARLCSIHFDESTSKTKVSKLYTPIIQHVQASSSTISNSDESCELRKENQDPEQGKDDLNQELEDVNTGEKDQAPQLCELEEENKSLKEKNDMLKQKLKDLNDSGKNPVWLFCEFKEENKILKKEIDDLKQKLEDMNGGVKKLVNLLNIWKKENRILKQENENLKQKLILKEVNVGENKLATLLNDWKEENKILKQENEELKQKLKVNGGKNVLYKIKKIPKKSSESPNTCVSSNNIFVIKNIPSKSLESQNLNIIHKEIPTHASESAKTCVTSSHIVPPVNETTTEQIESPNLKKDMIIPSNNKFIRKRPKVPVNKIPTKQIRSSNLKLIFPKIPKQAFESTNVSSSTCTTLSKNEATFNELPSSNLTIPQQETSAAVSFIESVPPTILLPENHTQTHEIESQDLELCPDKAKILYPRKCDVCLKSFSCKSSFFRHKRKQHGNSTNEIFLVLSDDITTD